MTWEPGCREVPATDPPDYQPPDDTATAPDGVVHLLDGCGGTFCGLDATGWSRFVTDAQRAGLVLFCEECPQAQEERAWEAWYQPGEGDRGGPDV